MIVPVVDITDVCMRVHQPGVAVLMRVWLTRIRTRSVGMAMMLVVDVQVVMNDGVVFVKVLVTLAEHSENPERHDRPGHDFLDAELFTQERPRRERSHEWRGGEDRRLAGRAEQT